MASASLVRLHSLIDLRTHLKVLHEVLGSAHLLVHESPTVAKDFPDLVAFNDRLYTQLPKVMEQIALLDVQVRVEVNLQGEYTNESEG